MIRNKKILKAFAILFLLEIILPIFSPIASYALTSGPHSPEFSSFEPVGTTNMVNNFTGDFIYNLPVLNVPGPDGAGYSMSLSYHSGVSPEEEASWVGYGWTLNPGAINRMVKGIPDDYKGAKMRVFNKTRPNWTAMKTHSFKLEVMSAEPSDEDPKKNSASDDNHSVGGGAFGFGDNSNVTDTKAAKDQIKTSDVAGGSIAITARYNNHMGFNRTFSFGADYKGMAGLNMSLSNGEVTFAPVINVQKIISDQKRKMAKRAKSNADFMQRHKLKSAKDKFKIHFETKDIIKTYKEAKRGNRAAANIARIRGDVFAVGSSPLVFNSPISVSKYYGKAMNVTFTGQVNVSQIHLGVQFGATGHYNIQAGVPEKLMSAYGYMYNRDWNFMKSKKNPPKLASNDIEHYVPIQDGVSGFHTDVINNLLPPIKDRNDIDLVSDYHTEKPSNFDVRDKIIGIPFHDADQFSVAGEGLFGGFRFHHYNVGHFYPSNVYSRQNIEQFGLDLSLGLNFGIGVGFSVNGHHESFMRNWDFPGRSKQLQFEDSNDNGFFKFNGDKGGEINYTNSNELLSSGLLRINPFPGMKVIEPKFDLNNLNDGNSKSIRLKETNTTGFIEIEKDETQSGVDDVEYSKIKGVFTTNSSGQIYHYGLPTMVKSQLDLSVNIDDSDEIKDRFLVDKQIANSAGKIDMKDHDIFVGQEKVEPYASSYLLTSIVSPDYIDINENNEKDEEDVGAWTKFEYKKIHNNYRFRNPVSGLLYSQNSISNKKDDVATLNTGTKEQYYLNSIETKTHIAYFVTNKSEWDEYSYVHGSHAPYVEGSQKIRKDSYGCDIDGGIDTDMDLEYLEKIVLFSKDRPDKPLRITHFDYSYTLCSGAENNSSTYNGKLTLNKVWFESNGVTKAKIAPYEFKYEYFKNYPTHITEKYSNIYNDKGLAEETNPSTEKYKNLPANMENPNYQPYYLDSWGNYQFGGKERKENLIPWVSQKENDSNFDPAAWNLKQIIMPSGAEIHIQYEQKEYASVQDRTPMAMVSLRDYNDTYETDNNKYILNIEDVGIAPGTPEHDDLIDELVYNIRQKYINDCVNRKKIYFKFLYALVGGDASLDNCQSEYITGYASINDVGIDNEGYPYVQLGNIETGECGSLSKMVKTIPRYVCYDYYQTNRAGMLNNTDCDDAEMEAIEGGYARRNDGSVIAERGNIGQAIYHPQTWENITHNWAFGWVGSRIKPDYAIPALKYVEKKIYNFKKKSKNEACREINKELSFLKIPMVTNKKGGGIRVKRLLMYDKGIEPQNADAVLYGKEYVYTTKEIRNGFVKHKSTGVATNEPNGGREESALVDFEGKRAQSWLDKIIAGRDKEQVEGPYGETILPAPSIGYSKVIIRDIHSGKTGTGYLEEKYFTDKDTPYDQENFIMYDNDGERKVVNKLEFTDLSKPQNVFGDQTKAWDFLMIPTPWLSYNRNIKWRSQGFRFIKYSKHGQPKSTAMYSGDFKMNGVEENNIPFAKTEYEYFEPGEKQKLLTFNTDNQKMIMSKGVPGKEEDITMEMRSIKENTNDISLELDIDIGLSWFPPIFFSFNASVSRSENQLSLHSTTKVINYPVVLKSVTTTTKNVKSVTENLAFNKATGQPVLTKTTDGYNDMKLYTDETKKHNGDYFNLDIPASWMYDKLGQKSKNTENFNILTASVGAIQSYGEEGNVLSKFENFEKKWDVNSDKLNNVLSSSAIVLDNNWYKDDSSYPQETNINSNLLAKNHSKTSNLGANVQAQLNELYKFSSSYVYKKDLDDEDKMYSSGTHDSFQFFDWMSPPTFVTNPSQGWLRTNNVILYDEFGNALEEQNILNIRSSVRYSNNNLLPAIVAQNASYNEILFKSFDQKEDLNNSNSYNVAHSGINSYKHYENPNFNYINASTDKIYLTQNLLDKGIKVSLWFQSDFSNLDNNLPSIKINNGKINKAFRKVAVVDDWALLEVDILSSELTNSSIPLLEALKAQIVYEISPGEKVFIDDFRFSPIDAIVSCSVYDYVDFKLNTSFDSNHFGTFYQYDNEGQLIRNIVETERGKATLKETQYNIPTLKQRP